MLKAFALMIGAGLGALLGNMIDPSHRGFGFFMSFVGGLTAWVIADFTSFKRALTEETEGDEKGKYTGRIFWSQTCAFGAVVWTIFSILTVYFPLGMYLTNAELMASFRGPPGMNIFEFSALMFVLSGVVGLFTGMGWGYIRLALYYLMSDLSERETKERIDGAFGFAVCANPIALLVLILKMFYDMGWGLIGLLRGMWWNAECFVQAIHRNVGTFYVFYGTLGAAIGYFAGFYANASVFQLHLGDFTITVNMISAGVGAITAEALAFFGRMIFSSQSLKTQLS